MKELQKLEELFSAGFISDDEYQQRKKQLLETAGMSFILKSLKIV
jgi:hypothetical protein